MKEFDIIKTMTIDGKIILTGLMGSNSYGTATETSDLDYMSIVIPNIKYYFGTTNWGNSGTLDDSYEDQEFKIFTEHKYFEFKKSIGLLSNFNPNIIPILWLKPNLYTCVTGAGKLLLENRNLFNSKRIHHTFSGFANGQLQKMGGIFNDEEEPNKLLKKGHGRFQEWAEEEIEYLRKFRDLEKTGKLQDARDNCDFGNREVRADEGYLNALIALKTHSKEELKRIKDGPITGRMGAKRKEIREIYGYDTKFANHTIRLMKMCVEFLKHPEEGLKVSRTGIDAEFLYSIRKGALSQEQVKSLANELFQEANEAVKTSPLPDKPDSNKIEDLSLQILKTELLY